MVNTRMVYHGYVNCIWWVHEWFVVYVCVECVNGLWCVFGDCVNGLRCLCNDYVNGLWCLCSDCVPGI